MTTKKTKSEETPTIPDTLSAIRKGGLVAEVQDLIPQVVQAVRDTGKVGEITVKLKFKRADADVVVISDDVTHKKPRREVPASLFFADDKNQLHRSDPRQADLNLQDAGDEQPANVKQLREV